MLQKTKNVQYWLYLYYSYVLYITNQVRRVGNAHDVTRTTHTFRVNNRDKYIQHQARVNTVSAQSRTPIKDRGTRWDLYSGTVAIDRVGLPLNQRLLFSTWRELGPFENVSCFTTKLPNLRTLRCVL